MPVFHICRPQRLNYNSNIDCVLNRHELMFGWPKLNCNGLVRSGRSALPGGMYTVMVASVGKL